MNIVTGGELTIRVLEYKTLELSESWASRDNCSSFWRLYLNDRPAASVLCGKSEYRISPGNFHFIPAWTRFSCRDVGMTNHFYIHFDLMGIPGVLVRKYWPAPLMLPGKASYGRTVREFETAQAAGLLAVNAHINKLVYSSLEKLFRMMPAGKTAEFEEALLGHSRFAAVIEYIESRLSEQMTNAKLAKKACMSEGHFVRSFSTTLGQPPARYVQERRIARASELLSFTDMPVEVISQQCGFTNRFHFSRIFRQIIGLPPAAYRLQKN